jgi:hypothetical protein
MLERERLVQQRSPRVTALFSELHDPREVVARIQSYRELGDREREFALRLALGEAVPRRLAEWRGSGDVRDSSARTEMNQPPIAVRVLADPPEIRAWGPRLRWFEPRWGHDMRTPRSIFALAWTLAILDFAVAQDTTRVSVDSSGAEGNSVSEIGLSLNATSADGTIVAFSSFASNLVPGDTNKTWDVFVHDRSTGVTERVSVDSSGAEANGLSSRATLSPDGRFVVFHSFASNLVAADTNGFEDVFVHDRSTGVTERVSVDSAGVQGNLNSGSTAPNGISANGQIVVFASAASNLVSGDTNGAWDIFVHDRSTGITECVDVDPSGKPAFSGASIASVSADGQLVAFYSAATNLVASDTNGKADAFVLDRGTGIIERVSVDSSGAEANDYSSAGMISITADGAVVVFVSLASNLVPGDTNGWTDVFVHDRLTGATERVSVDSSGVEGNFISWNGTISDDHRFVAFTSLASNLVSGDTNGVQDAFVHDRSTGLTERVSVSATGVQANLATDWSAISADGEVVAFQSTATNLVPGDLNNAGDVFLRERCDAYWSNYGTGFPGTNGIPSLTSRTDPVLGTTVTLDISNSSGISTFGVLFIGYQRAQIPTGRGGDLLVDPLVTVFVNIPASGTTFTGDIPNDSSLCGFKFDVQAIESDLGAAMRLSFTPGLELVLGY